MPTQITAECLTRDRDAIVTIDKDPVFGKVDNHVLVFDSGVGRDGRVSRCHLCPGERKRK
jgi:hypothetical protein